MLIWDRALAFMDAQILLTAEKLGTFNALEEDPRTAAEVAQWVGIPEDSALRLLTALCSQDLVERRADDLWANTPEASEKLVRGKPGYIGDLFCHLRDDLYPLWHHLEGALRDGGAQWHRLDKDGPSPTESVYDDPERLRAFMEGMHAITYPSARDLAEAEPALNEIGLVVDVGGAAGSFLVGLAERHRRLEGVVFDLPPVEPIAQAVIRRHELEDRLSFLGGNFWEDRLPSGADAYCLGFILHDWDTGGGCRILARIAEASRPGTWLILGEYLLEEDRTGPAWVARQDLNMLIAARGRERTAAEYRQWIGEFGFELKRIHLTGNGKSFLIARFQ